MTCEGENGRNGSYLDVFSDDIVFSCHFVASCLPHALPHYRSARDNGYASKKLSKMVGDSASYPVYNRYSELL